MECGDEASTLDKEARVSAIGELSESRWGGDGDGASRRAYREGRDRREEHADRKQEPPIRCSGTGMARFGRFSREAARS